MQSNGVGPTTSSPHGLKAEKFTVYQNPTLSAALTANSLQPSKSNILCIFTLSSLSAFALLSVISRESTLVDQLRFGYLSKDAAFVFAKTIQIIAALLFIGTICAFYKAITLNRARNSIGVPIFPPSKGKTEQPHLTSRQLGLLGLKPKVVDKVTPESLKKPPKSQTPLRTSSDTLVPLHQPFGNSHRKPPVGSDKSNPSSGSKINNFSSPYLVSANTSPLRSVHNSPGQDVSTPWSKTRSMFSKDITTEDKLEQFLAEVNDRITESAGKLSTPPPTISGFGVTSPTVGSSANASGNMRSTPLRPVRMSPGSQKFTPPKKGEGEFPPPMSIEESIAAFQQLGIYPEIEQWRDRLRQWFSSVLLKPLLDKIETSHIQVMHAAAKLGISITINQVGSEITTSGISAPLSSASGTQEWQPAFTLDEDSVLHQIRATLVQSLDSSTQNSPLGNMQQSPQQISMIPLMQECVDAITEHQKLQSLMKGEIVKGLLPHSNVRADYTVQRTRELAEGTCLKNFEYLGTGEVYDKKNKKWTLELPTDSHLLLYLFCAYLEHPKWMLHVDPTSYAGAHSSKNPLFLGVLPPKERFPEKYIAVISGVPSVLHPGACVLTVGKQSPPPIFALYWEKKIQLTLQGRTALWDSVLVLCHRVKVGYGGIVRGLHLGSSALNILPVLDSEMED
ncbi:hypothetical protein ACFE04_017565 [Oxalis oulophora]